MVTLTGSGAAEEGRARLVVLQDSLTPEDTCGQSRDVEQDAYSWPGGLN
jgi:hypothetical protein